MNKICLAQDTISSEDLMELSDWLKTNPRLTKGELTEKFEEKFSKYIGTRYSVFVNSGSSAILLMLSALIELEMISRGDQIVVPNVSWSTDASSVINLGLKPIFCDCNLDDLSIDLIELENIFLHKAPAALLLVQVLGLVPNMGEIIRLCSKYDVILLEDTCESMGSMYDGQMLGSLGFASVFSTYFGHHISTIEGGFICTDDFVLYEMLKMLRSHGWDRDLDPISKMHLKNVYDIDDFKSRYTFYAPSYNLRSTDLQAFIGIGQMGKLDFIHSTRERNFNRYLENLKNVPIWKPKTHGFCSNFAYPIISKNKNKIVDELVNNGIECRPLICGDMEKQPFILDKLGHSIIPKPNATMVDKFGFYVPNHPFITLEDVDNICDIIKENHK